MKRLITALLVLLTAASVRAEGPAALVLEVRAKRVHLLEFERALDEEFKASTGTVAEEPSGHLALTQDTPDRVQLTYRDSLGKTATRELQIAHDDPEALEKITLAAANLVRDQSIGLLAELRASQPKSSQGPEDFDSEKPPPVTLAEVAPPPVSYNPCRDGRALVFGGDLAPLLGTSSTQRGRDAARHFSLNLAGSYSAGVRGLELSVGFNIARRGTCGAQYAVGFNLSLGEVRGLQYALANLANGRVRGTQVGVGNFARNGANVQVGVGNVSGGDVRGAQVAVGNLTWGGVRGVQVGVGNFARGNVTAQIGVVNISRQAKAPIGVFSIVREGRTTLDAWVSENGTLLSGISHGGEYVHNLYAVGFRFGPAGTRVGYAIGIGARFLNRPWLRLDLDTLFEQWSKTDYIESSAMVARLRLTASISLTDRLGIFVAPGYAIMLTDDPTETTQSPLGSQLIARSVDPASDKRQDAIGFSSISVGLRVALNSTP